jgi:UDP-glucose 4-epimerase
LKSTILVTGGAGYIGSHTVIELLLAGAEVVIVDNFCNSSAGVLRRIEQISGRTVPFVEADVRDRRALDAVFRTHRVDAVIHFAGLKAVGESVARPLEYFDNNLVSTLTLLEAMRVSGVRRFVFSSSATVYGDPATVPIREDCPLKVTNPYGRTKLMCEQILADLQAAEPQWQIATLRYFNPVGAHESGLIGEAPSEAPNNLIPYVCQVAAGKREYLAIFGNDYPTPDGTGVRDYIHVVDLARGHVSALRYMDKAGASVTVNLGTGTGISVLQIVEAFEQVNDVRVPRRFTARRPGDIAVCYADPSLANRLLGWRAEKDLDSMCRDAWRWQLRNPAGFAG